MSLHNNFNIALFIDGDNASHKQFENNYKNNIIPKGNVIIKKVYFDFHSKTKSSDIWDNSCTKFGIEPILVPNLKGKNSSDIRMITDIMETLYENDLIDVYIIMTADSDFSHVVSKLRAKGKIVIGIGKEDAPKKLINSCDQYIINSSKLNDIHKVIRKIDNLLINLFEESAVNEIQLSVFKENIIKEIKTFDQNHYGIKTFKRFIEKYIPNIIIKTGKGKYHTTNFISLKN